MTPEKLNSLGVAFAFVGPGGSGKTTLAAGAAESPKYGGEVLALDAEGGAKVIAGLPHVHIAHVATWNEIDKVTDEFVAGKYPEIGSVILDNLVEYSKLNLKKYTGATGAAEYKEWGQNFRDMGDFIRRWRDLTTIRNINVFFIGWDSYEKIDETNKTKRHISFTPALQKEFPGIVDSVGMLDPVDGNPDLRQVDFTPSTRSITKFRRGRNEHAMKIPYVLRYGLSDLPMKYMLATMKGGEPFPTTRFAVKLDK